MWGRSQALLLDKTGFEASCSLGLSKSHSSVSLFPHL